MQAVDWRFPFQGEGQQDWYADIFGPGAVADSFGSADASLLGRPTTRRQSLRPATGGGLPKDSRMRDGRTIPSIICVAFVVCLKRTLSVAVVLSHSVTDTGGCVTGRTMTLAGTQLQTAPVADNVTVSPGTTFR